MENRYPRVEINLAHLQHNVSKVVEKCGSFGIQVAGVIKGATGIPEVARAFDKGGAAFIASSRLEQLEDAINAGIEKPMMLIRIPMLSEVKDVIRLADISLNSEFEVIKALNDEARAQGKLHKMINIQLVGIGTNVGCYGSISPTVEKLEELVELAERIEERLGRQLEYISGGATSSLMRVWDKNIPKRINMLRVGEGILLARDLDVFYGYDMSDLYQDIFRLKAEVIEVKDKPSYPVGTIAIDAFGHTPTYVDRGIRRRALLAMGKVDYGDPVELLPMDKGIEVLGASSDHTIIDVEDAERDYKVGDIMTFDICYATVVYLTNCRNVHIAFV